MNKEKLEAQLAEIISRRSGLSPDKVLSLKEESLLGPKIRMPARELLHVYFDVEKAFGVSIPEASIEEGRFKSFQSIVQIIKDALCAAAAKKG